MNGFYTITQSLNDQLKANGFNVTTLGDAFKVDLARQTVFPYAHIVPVSVAHTGTLLQYSFRIIGMDSVDFNKDDLRNEEETFYGIDNLQDVLNDIHNRLNNTVEYYRRGDGTDLNIDLVDGSVSYDAFFERYENLLAGWVLNITIEIPNDATIC